MNMLPRIALCWTLLAPVALAGEEPQVAAQAPHRVLALAPADPLFMLWTTDLPALLDNGVAAIIAGEAGGADLSGLARAWEETFGGPATISVRAKALRPDALGISFAAQVSGDADDLFVRLGNFASSALVGPGGDPLIEVGRDGSLITVRVVDLPLALTLYLGVKNGVAFGDTWRQAVVDYIQGSEPAAGSRRFIDTDAFKTLPAASDLLAGHGDLLAYLDLRPLIALGRTQVGVEGNRLFDAFGLGAFESVALTADWSGKTLSATLSVAVTDEQSGLAKLLVPVNRKIQAASMLPADCPAAWCGAMTNASDFVDRLGELLDAVDMDIVDEYRAELAEATREFGFDPQHDFLANLVDEWAVGVQVGEDDKPQLILVVKLADANLFQQHFQNLVTGYRLPIETTVYRGVQIVSRGDAGSPAVALAVIDDYLVIGGSTGQLVSAIEARAEGKTLDTSPGIKAVAGRLPSQVSSLGLLNIARFAQLALAEMDQSGNRADSMAVPVFERARGTDAAMGLAVTARPGMIVAEFALNESGTAVAVETVGESIAASLAESRYQSSRIVSMSRMKGIVTACLSHAEKHDCSFPSSLGDLVAQGLLSVEMFRSPYDGSGPTDSTEVDRMSFYLYQPGLNVSAMKQPSSTVVLVEREIHRERGANVAFADGHVEWIEEPQAGEIIAQVQHGAR
jgi:prepilin-type processing-associated H-X9-DG protein